MKNLTIDVKSIILLLASTPWLEFLFEKSINKTVCGGYMSWYLHRFAALLVLDDDKYIRVFSKAASIRA